MNGDSTRNGGDSISPRDPDRNAVLFWNDVALGLVARDSSMKEAEVRAAGPAATARALGLAQAVVADATRQARPQEARWEPFRDGVRADGPIGEPGLFIGGAAAAILRHIYNGAEHRDFIDRRQAVFLRAQRRDDRGDFERGERFGSDDAYRREWNYRELFPLLDRKDTTYKPGPRQHNVDPFNPDQGFYGQRWAEAPPFVLNRNEIGEPGIAPPTPPEQGSDRYEAGVEDVRARGVLRGSVDDPMRSREQEDVGLFWAYDGARLIGTPPRFYNQIVVEIAQRDRLSDVELARLLALCNLAMADAGIVTWRAKYKYAVWRPVLGVRDRVDPGRSDPDWTPLGSPRTNRDFRTQPGLGVRVSPDAAGEFAAQNVVAGPPGGGGAARASVDPKRYSEAAFTPNFPAYPSGHATFGAACFDVLRRVRAERQPTQQDPDDLRRQREPFVSDELNGRSVDNFHDERRPLRPQRFETIGEMIDLNNESRVWLGVHWQFDAEEGAASGKAVAGVVHGRALRRI